MAQESAEDLFEHAPCGYLSCSIDGTIIRVNRTFETWTGYDRGELVGRAFRELLTPAGRIYHETHCRPLLTLRGSVREVALDIVCASGARLPALINSTQRLDEAGRPQTVRTTITEATDRRFYERELLRAGRLERDIAVQLQRSLLAGELASSKSLCVDARYHAAQLGMEVGGDWYDVFWLQDEETVGLVVGDVVGHDIAAAAAMGQLRSATRALALTGLPPGRLLDALDAYAVRHDVGRMTTAIYAELHTCTGDMRYAAAGHPPPLLINPDKDPEYLWDGRSAPLHAIGNGSCRSQATTRIETGGTLLLYTDGLIERRRQSLDLGLEHLASEAGEHHALELGPLLTRLVDRMGDNFSDDRCLLGARRLD
jgi:PAS domain S-box-containing protein